MTAQEPRPPAAAAAPQTESNPTATASDFPAIDVPPLARIVLYNSGVGHMEHRGTVTGNARVELRFGAQSVDDALKSLVFADTGGGTIRAVEYQAAPGPEDVAASDLGRPMTVAQLLQYLRGEQLRLRHNETEVVGTIVGVENRTTGQNLREVVVLATEDGLHSVALDEVTLLQFDDEQIREQLRLAMQGVAGSRQRAQRRLELLFEGQQERDVRFAYVVDAPIWRMTYRLETKGGEAHLQGWAHVDNATGVDWTNVQLELRSGRPFAYHANLFAPLAAQRTSVGHSPFEIPAGLPLVTQWFGFEPAPRFQADERSMREGTLGGGGGFGGGGGLRGGIMGGAERAPRTNVDGQSFDITSAFRAAAQQTEAAAMVRLTIDQPVTLNSGRSAALPVFAKTVAGRSIGVYRDYESPPAVYRAFELTNDTGMPLVAGPVTVVHEADFVGEGAIVRVNVDQKTKIIYGLDRSLSVTKNVSEPERELREIRWEDKYVVLEERRLETITFDLTNHDAEDRTVVIEFHPPGGAKIAELEVAEDEDGMVEFETQVAARENQQFQVRIERRSSERVPIDQVTAMRIAQWLGTIATVEQDVREKLLSLQQLLRQIEQANTEHSRVSAARSALVQEQSRVRENIRAVQHNAEVVAPYYEQLGKLEEQLREMDARLSAAHTRVQQLEQQRRDAMWNE